MIQRSWEDFEDKQNGEVATLCDQVELVIYLYIVVQHEIKSLHEVGGDN